MPDDTKLVIALNVSHALRWQRKLRRQESDYEDDVLDEHAARTMGGVRVPGLRYIAFMDQILRAIRCANHQWPQEFVDELRGFGGGENAEHVAQHGNKREPSDGTPMLAKRAHKSKLGRVSMPVNR